MIFKIYGLTSLLDIYIAENHFIKDKWEILKLNYSIRVSWLFFGRIKKSVPHKMRQRKIS